MSELMNKQNGERGFRWRLLTTVSAVALLAAVYGSNESEAADQDADRPTVWIELGGQMENISGQGEVFAPAFLAANPASPVLQPTTPLQAQRPAKFSFGEEGKISFQPDGSDWIFSAAIRYGRSSNARHVDHQTTGTHHKYYRSGIPVSPSSHLTAADFADTHAQRRESHAILDFTAGKDVGLGMLGRGSSSTLNFGVRFAQFTSKATFDIRARPDLQFKYATFPSRHATFLLSHFNTYHATGQASRSFRGLGPSLSWNGSAPLVGNSQGGEIAFDWGANAAILFGKQKARVQHHESAHYLPTSHVFNAGNLLSLVYDHPDGGHSGVRSVTVPNAGGFAGISFRKGDAKVSFGYRADFFFGAIDGGIDAAKKENVGFYGPFATISVGLGG
jgi:iron complex outermembrane recepter protein